MNKRFWRFVLVAGTSVFLAGCGNKETKEALQKSSALEAQKQYYDANNILTDALKAREIKIRTDAGSPPDSGTPIDPTVADALNKKVAADPEILKMERAQIPLYLHLERPDMASAVYTDILLGNPGDTVVYDTLKGPGPGDSRRGGARPRPEREAGGHRRAGGCHEGPGQGRSPRRRGRARDDQGPQRSFRR